MNTATIIFCIMPLNSCVIWSYGEIIISSMVLIHRILFVEMYAQWYLKIVSSKIMF
jgi:hypothetical protein